MYIDIYIYIFVFIFLIDKNSVKRTFIDMKMKYKLRWMDMYLQSL